MNFQFDDKIHWYKDAIIYELHIKAFFDSNGDGVGDLQGLIQKLDYLCDLGVTAIWLLPFYPSPLRDDGYDISDYYSLNEAYGNIGLFKTFLEEAHVRKLKVITELIINHTSDQHPWFQRARNAPKGSDERNYYVWTDDPMQYKDVRIIFQDYEASNWTWDPIAQQYYWHRFFYHQPDLNFDNPMVQQEVFAIIDFWCGLGVDGFRLDAVPYLFERDGTNCENLPETHVFLKKLRAYVDERYPGTLLLAEANMWPEEAAAYFGDGDECHMNYHFPVMPRMFMALQMEDRYPITDIFDQTPAIPKNCQWAIFLRNHDELTLEMVTDEERDYMYKVYATDPKARINLGIRQRLAPLMQNNRRKIELINSLLFSLPGTPVIYYGDEIGMGDNFYLGDRDGVRTPMQWSANRNGGFSDTNPQKLYLPLILSPEYHYEIVNVEMQSANPSSLLWFMKRIIDLRKKYKSLSRGDFKIITTDNPKILAFTRCYEEETLLIILNLSRYAQPTELDLKDFEGYQPIEVQSRNKFPVIKNVRYFLSMAAYSYQWYSLQRVNSAVKSGGSIIELKVNHINDLMIAKGREMLFNRILPTWLKTIRWFGGKSREIQNIVIEQQESLSYDEQAVWLLIKVEYYYGLPEIYQLPLVFIKSNQSSIISEYPQCVITKLWINDQEGYLCDALYDRRMQEFLMKTLSTFNDVKSNSRLRGTSAISNTKDNCATPLTSKVLNAEQSNTSIVYGDCYYMKIYRKVDYEVNPDKEMIKMLTNSLKFSHIPPYLGSIEWLTNKGNITLAILQSLVENHGDAWTHMQEKLIAFNDNILSMPPDNMPENTLYGTLTAPIGYDELPDNIKSILDATVAEQARLIGQRTAEMHLSLASAKDPAFKPEPYSLHYQRSIFSNLSTQVREAFQNLERNIEKLNKDSRQMAEQVLKKRNIIVERLRAVYSKKIDIHKIRIHGDYHLGQLLFTGKDLMILDFEGEPARSYSERRLKFSAIRDIAGMIRSFHYAAFGSLFLESETRNVDSEKLIPYASMWSHYMSGFFMKAYLEIVKGTYLIPNSEEDLKILLDAFLTSKAFYELNYELNNRPEWVLIPLRGVLNIHEQNTV